MTVYPIAIEGTNPLVSGDGRDNQAPAIDAGDPFGNHAEQAALEYDNRKRMREASPTSVSDAEIKESRRRLVAIEMVEAQVTHGMGMGAVLAAIAETQAAVAKLGAETQAAMAETQAAVAETQAAIANLGAETRAAFSNLRRRERNRNNKWNPLLVERHGVNPVGVVPPDCPATRDDVLGLSSSQINALERAFNLPAGHFNGATLASRRGAVLRYFTEP